MDIVYMHMYMYEQAYHNKNCFGLGWQIVYNNASKYGIFSQKGTLQRFRDLIFVDDRHKNMHM